MAAKAGSAAKKTAQRSTVMASALTRALKGVETLPEDAAAVALARTYARRIDEDASMLWRLGPRLLETLVELRMTPKARAGVLREVVVTRDGGDGGDPREDALDALTREHAERSR